MRICAVKHGGSSYMLGETRHAASSSRHRWTVEWLG